MRRWAKARAALALLFILGATSFAGPASSVAHNESPEHVNAACSTGNPAFNHQVYLDPLFHHTDYYDYVEGRATVRQLLQCSNSNGTDYGFSIVNPANLVVPGYGLIQLGYGVCNVCGLTQTNEDFWFTKELDGGIDQAGWVDFDNDGLHNFPVQGVEYEFSISIIAPNTSGAYVRFCVADVDGWYAGMASCQNKSTANWPKAEYVWWSYERQNGASAIGQEDGTGSINMHKMKYSLTGPSNAAVLTGGGQTVYWYKANQGIGGTGTSYSYVDAVVSTDASNNTKFGVNTDPHQ